MPRVSILDRYILREFLVGTLAATVVLLVLFAGGAFAGIINKVASGRLPGNIMFTLLGLNMVNTLQALLPMAMFLGILLGLGRLYRDSEMQVLSASGFGPRGLLKPAAAFALGTAVLVALVALWLGPLAARTAQAEITAANRSVIAAGLQAGRFTTLPGRAGVLFAGSVSANGSKLGQLFVSSEQTDKNGVTSISVITADRGKLFESGTADNRFIALFDGQRYDIRLGRDDWRMMHFQRNDIGLSPPTASADEGDVDSLRSTAALLASHDPAARAELQWRIGIPFGVLALAMLGLPLARQTPRSSPAGRVLIGVLAYLVIMNLMTLGRSFISAGHVPAGAGMWWVLVPVFAGAAWAFARQYRTRTPRAAGAEA